MPSYTPTFGAGDALAAQTLYDLKNFTDWLASNGVRGIITEMGIPGSSQAATDPIPGSGTGAKYDERWSNVMQQWYEAANRAYLHVTMWNVSEWRVDLRAAETDDGNNKPLNYRTTSSSVVINNPSVTSGPANQQYMRGVNYAGGEFSDRGPNGSLDRSHFSQPNAGYYYPDTRSFAILKTLGMGDLIRLPIRWERVQPTLKGALDTTELAPIVAAINAAGAAGGKVLIDIHNYARYDTTPTGANANGVYSLGQNAPATHNGATVGGTMNDCFADLWSRLATYFQSNSAVWGYDICNEPHDLPAGVSDWQAASRAAVEAIRLVDPTQTKYIAVEGYVYATVPAWQSTNGSTQWLTETIPAGQTGAGGVRGTTDTKILFNGHHYFDPATNGYDGGYQDTYDTELSRAAGQGFGPWSTSGYTPPATSNTVQSGLRTTFSTSFDDIGSFGGQYDAVNQNSNTVTIPYTGAGNPGSSMRVIATATSDEGGVRKSLTAAANAKIAQFDFLLPNGVTLDTTNNFAIAHAWDGTYTNDLIEIRIIGSGSGFKVVLLTPFGSYVQTVGTTVFSLGVWHTLKLVLTDTAYQLFVDGATTPEISFTASLASTFIGGFALGKFYGTSYVGSMYFDNLSVGLNANFTAPPNGGYIAFTGGGGGGGGGGGSTRAKQGIGAFI